jgi:hypothetical protein
MIFTAIIERRDFCLASLKLIQVTNLFHILIAKENVYNIFLG